MRRCSCDWNREIDARVAIDRLDATGADMTPEEIARRFSDLSAWIEGVIEFDMRLIRYYREHHGVNTLLRSGKIDEMGGLPKQAYYDGIHEIDDRRGADHRNRVAAASAATGKRSSATTGSAPSTGSTGSPA